MLWAPAIDDTVVNDVLRSIKIIDDPKYIFYNYFKDVSREFDEFRINTHRCKLRCWYL